MLQHTAVARRAIRRGAPCAAILAASLGGAIPALAQPTAITYQGHLQQNGSPANGAFNMTFKLFDALAAGTQQGPTLIFDGAGGNPPPVSVSKGLFTVSLDFGVAPYTANQNRWLEIAISGTPLTPRQALTAAPFALNARGINVAATGNVGVGTTTPAQKLSVAGTVQSTSGGFMFPDGSVQSSAATGGGGYWSSNGTHIYKNNAGSVGIGTSNPTSLLDVRGFVTFDTGGDAAIHTGTAGLDLNRYLVVLNSPAYQSASGLKAGGILCSDNFFYANPGKNDLVVKGVVGIGTPTPGSPLTIQTVDSIFSSGVGWTQTDGTRDLSSIVNSSGGWLGTRTNHPLHLYANNSSARVTVSPFGTVGIGTTTPAHQLTVATGSGTFGVVHTDGIREVGTYVSASGGWLGTRSNHSLHFFTNNSNQLMTLTTAGNLGIGTTAPAQKLDVNGTARVKVLEIVGADVAEKFPTADARPEPGTVMEIDPDHPGKLRVSREAYNTRVAGIVSGAGDLPVGAVLGHLPGHEDAPPIALSGRVWCRCDAAAGAIRPGDLLTTSSTPGHAARATERERSHGAIIGKAMTSLRGGETGLVLVLVNLQ